MKANSLLKQGRDRQRPGNWMVQTRVTNRGVMDVSCHRAGEARRMLRPCGRTPRCGLLHGVKWRRTGQNAFYNTCSSTVVAWTPVSRDDVEEKLRCCLLSWSWSGHVEDRWCGVKMWVRQRRQWTIDWITQDDDVLWDNFLSKHLIIA